MSCGCGSTTGPCACPGMPPGGVLATAPSFAPSSSPPPSGVVAPPAAQFLLPAPPVLDALPMPRIDSMRDLERFAPAGSRLVTFARNLLVIATSAGNQMVRTDPVPLDGHDRASCVAICVYGFRSDGGGSSTFTCGAEVSEDGVNWVGTSITLALTSGSVASQVGAVHGGFLRFYVSVSSPPTGIAAACVDLRVLLDHA